MKQDTFSTFDIVQFFGIPLGRLREWLVRGFIKPSIQQSVSKGTKNIFNLDDLCCIYLFNLMMTRKNNREVAATALKVLRRVGFQRIIKLKKPYLVVREFIDENSEDALGTIMRKGDDYGYGTFYEKLPEKFEEESWAISIYNLPLILRKVREAID